MVINKKDLNKVIDTIEEVIGNKLEANIKKELEEGLKRVLVNIDITVYYEMLYLVEDVREIKSIITKYNLLLGEEFDARLLSYNKKIELMHFLISYSELFGMKEKLMSKIEEDISLI